MAARQTRIPGGRDLAALFAYIEARTATPFAWGRDANDCVSFAAQGVKAQTGHHRLGDLRWGSKAGALRLLARLGGLEAAIDARFSRLPPALAMRGDIAGIADDELGIRLMLVEGDMLVGPGALGLRRLKRPAMIAAWSATAPPPEAHHG